MSQTASFSLRARNKARTHDALVKAALALFAERGFEGTTVEDIAAAAEVSPRTFFRYFATKEEVIFGEFPDAMAELIATLDARPADEPLMTSLRQAVRTVTVREVEDPVAALVLLRLVNDTPALAATYLTILNHGEEEVVAWAAARLGTTTDDVRPRLLAATAVAARRVAVDVWLSGGGTGDLQSLLDEALDHLATGLDSL